MSTTDTTSKSWFQGQVEQFERYRFGAMTMMITAQTCLAAVAAMLSIQNDNYFLVSVCSVFAMASNTAFIAQVNAKLCVTFFYLSIIVSAIVIPLNFLMY